MTEALLTIEPRRRGQHVPQRRAGAAEGAVQGDVEDGAPLRVGHLGQRGVAAEAGVVDDDVEVAVLGDRGVEEVLHLRLVGDVARDRQGRLAGDVGQLLGGLAQAALVPVADHDPGALLGAALGRREADAGTGGGGDQHRAAGEQVVARMGLGYWHGLTLRHGHLFVPPDG